MGVKFSNNISCESTHRIHSQKFMHTRREGLCQRCSKNCEISNFGLLPIFFYYMGPVYGVKVSNDISKTHQMCSPKFMHTAGEGPYQGC